MGRAISSSVRRTISSVVRPGNEGGMGPSVDLPLAFGAAAAAAAVTSVSLPSTLAFLAGLSPEGDGERPTATGMAAFGVRKSDERRDESLETSDSTRKGM